ncbi:TPA: hypothetical protein L1145_002996 [Escherichia coli]|nr:hypothetical protein [Escherichia coli]
MVYILIRSTHIVVVGLAYRRAKITHDDVGFSFPWVALNEPLFGCVTPFSAAFR